MNKILIDTNIYSSALRGDTGVVRVLKRVSHIGISAVSLGELLSGFRGGKPEQENREELAFFLDSPRVVLYPVSVSVHPCVSFVVRDRSIKVNFIGRLRAMKMACGRTPRRAAGDDILQRKSPHL